MVIYGEDGVRGEELEEGLLLLNEGVDSIGYGGRVRVRVRVDSIGYGGKGCGRMVCVWLGR